ncbi:hypothetical protein [Paenibacillus polymyxa]|uniref:hypothetical protein n=1 Tax=Paenibacillus polymyxa TaxID=1406 RepID=UPI002ECFD3FD|nr:hypothetical protein [Paenibacillus polymyxa]
MRIIVNNQYEADLISRFINDGHEHRIMDLLKLEITKYPDENLELEGEDFRILEDAVFWGDTTIEIDPKEEELRFAGDYWVTRGCIYCGTHTLGDTDIEPLTYSSWKWLDSPETRANWRCEECARKLCPACSEHLIENDEDDECKVCMEEEQQLQITTGKRILNSVVKVYRRLGGSKGE